MCAAIACEITSAVLIFFRSPLETKTGVANSFGATSKVAPAALFGASGLRRAPVVSGASYHLALPAIFPVVIHSFEAEARPVQVEILRTFLRVPCTVKQLHQKF
jgi:hypothetical protein